MDTNVRQKFSLPGIYVIFLSLSLSLRLTVQFNKHKIGTKIKDIGCESSCKLDDTANKSKWKYSKKENNWRF